MRKNIMWNTLGSVFYCVCQWLITLLVVHLSGYEDAGFLGLAMTTSSSFSAISLFSMRNFQVSDVLEEYKSGQYVGSRILTCIIAFICCSIGACFGNSLYQILCIDAFMLVRVAEAIVDVLHGINQKNNRYDLIGKSYILRGIATIVVFSAGSWISNNLLVTLVVMAIVNLAIAFLFDWTLTKKIDGFKPKIDKKVLELLKRCVPIAIFSFLLSLENLIPKNVLQQCYGTEELGIYSSIASPTLVVQVFASVAFSPFLPMISKAYVEERYEDFLKMLRKAYVALMAMGFIVTGGAIVFGKFGLRILYGEDIIQHYEIFLPIVWVTILTAIIWILSSVVVALRKINPLLIGMGIDFMVCILLVHPLIIRFEKNGVSIVQIICLSLYVAYMIVLCEVTVSRKRKERIKK